MKKRIRNRILLNKMKIDCRCPLTHVVEKRVSGALNINFISSYTQFGQNLLNASL